MSLDADLITLIKGRDSYCQVNYMYIISLLFIDMQYGKYSTLSYSYVFVFRI